MNEKCILFITTNKSEYYKEISKYLHKIFFSVDIVFDESKSFFGRVSKYIKLGSYIRKLQDRKILKLARTRKYTHLFILRGGGISPELVLEIKKLNPNIKCIMYQWDSVKNHDFTLLINVVDYAYSFDYQDCESYDLKYKPLFYLDDFNLENVELDVYSLGTAYRDRIIIMNELSTLFDRNNISYNFYLYMDKWVHFKNILLRSTLFSKDEKRFIKYKQVPLKTVRDEMYRSRVILDINSPLQSGLTIRTLESLGLGKKLITTNSNIAKEPFYDPNKILIIDRDKLEYKKILSFVKNESQLHYDYCLENWVFSFFSHDDN